MDYPNEESTPAVESRIAWSAHPTAAQQETIKNLSHNCVTYYGTDGTALVLDPVNKLLFIINKEGHAKLTADYRPIQSVSLWTIS